jgi:hypothetical protein
MLEIWRQLGWNEYLHLSFCLRVRFLSVCYVVFFVVFVSWWFNIIAFPAFPARPAFVVEFVF